MVASCDLQFLDDVMVGIPLRDGRVVVVEAVSRVSLLQPIMEEVVRREGGEVNTYLS